MGVTQISGPDPADSSPARRRAEPGRGGGGAGCFHLIAGMAVGVALSVGYVKFDWTPPGWLQLPGLVQGLGSRTVADGVLEDPDAGLGEKQRAVEELFRHDPNLFRELDDALGNSVTQAVIDRKARRHLMLFQAKQKTMRDALWEDVPALRAAAMREYGAGTIEELAVKLGVELLRDDVFLQAYAERYFPDLSDEDRFESVLALSPNEVFPPPPMP